MKWSAANAPFRVPSSLKSELAGMVIETPFSSGFFCNTDAGKVTKVSLLMLTGCNVPWTISGRNIWPFPPARLSTRPALASHALPTNG